MNLKFAVFKSDPSAQSPCDFSANISGIANLLENNTPPKKVAVKCFKTRVRRINVTNLPSYVHYTEKQKIVEQSIDSVESLKFDNVLTTSVVQKGVSDNSRKLRKSYVILSNKSTDFPISIGISQKGLLLIGKISLPSFINVL